MTEPEYNDAVVMAVRAKKVNGAQGTSIEKLWNDLKEGFNKNFIVENRYQMILTGLKTTVIISLGAVLLGTILGIIFCAMRRSSKKFLRNADRHLCYSYARYPDDSISYDYVLYYFWQAFN